LDWRGVSQARSTIEEETGTVRKDWGGRIPVALVYPNTYYIGMSNLGLHVIYRLFNEDPDFVCERVFHTGDGNHPISLESQRPMGEFAVVAYTLPFELDYLHIPAMLRNAGIPVSADDRDERHPLLIAGGACVMANPEPLAPIFDAFVIGEGEAVLSALTDVLCKSLSGERDELLKQLARVPGVYVPSLYHVATGENRAAGTTSEPGVPHPVERQWLSDLDAYPATSVIMTGATQFGDMYLIEVTRGCARGCHFCLAGAVYLPMRERSLSGLLAQAKEGLKHRGKIGLIGASLSDYSHIEELASELRAMGAKISVASLRVDPLPEQLLQALADSGVQTLTVAPEAGSERLRRAIRKGVTNDDIMRASELAARYDFQHLKLYFMVGLPGETDEDAQQIVDLTRAVNRRFSRRVTVNITPFVPKAQTPFQWSGMAPLNVLEQRIDYVKSELRSFNVDVKAESSRWSEVQGVLARGDRRVGEALMAVENRTLSSWRRAMNKTGLSPQTYLGERSRHETLPWAVVGTGTAPASCGAELAERNKNDTLGKRRHPILHV
jgi:radical SAM superfamily enzyme YgiQ (UPF0313 family)